MYIDTIIITWATWTRCVPNHMTLDLHWCKLAAGHPCNHGRPRTFTLAQGDAHFSVSIPRCICDRASLMLALWNSDPQ